MGTKHPQATTLNSDCFGLYHQTFNLFKLNIATTIFFNASEETCGDAFRPKSLRFTCAESCFLLKTNDSQGSA